MMEIYVYTTFSHIFPTKEIQKYMFIPHFPTKKDMETGQSMEIYVYTTFSHIFPQISGNLCLCHPNSGWLLDDQVQLAPGGGPLAGAGAEPPRHLRETRDAAAPGRALGGDAGGRDAATCRGGAKTKENHRKMMV